MKTYFYKNWDFQARDYAEAEKMVIENFGYCDADELFEED